MSTTFNTSYMVLMALALLCLVLLPLANSFYPLQSLTYHGSTSSASFLPQGTGKHLDTSALHFSPILPLGTGKHFDTSGLQLFPGLPTCPTILVPTHHPSWVHALAPSAKHKGAFWFWFCPSGSAMLPLVCLHHQSACLTQTFGHKGDMAVWSYIGVHMHQHYTTPNCKVQPLDTSSNKAIELLASVLLAIEVAGWSHMGVQMQQQDTRPNCKEVQQASGTNSNKAIELLTSALLAICQLLDLALGNQPSWLLPHMVCTGTTSSQPAMTLKAKRGWVY